MFVHVRVLVVVPTQPRAQSDPPPPPPAPPAALPPPQPQLCPVNGCQWSCRSLDDLCPHLTEAHRELWEVPRADSLQVALNKVMHPVKATWGHDAGFCRTCKSWWADTRTGRRAHNNSCAGLSEALMKVLGHRARAGVPVAAGQISITDVRVTRLPNGEFDVGGKKLVACECGSTFTDSKGVNHRQACFYCSLAHLDPSCTAELLKFDLAPLANKCAVEKAPQGVIVVDYAAPNQCASEDSVFAYVAQKGDVTLVRSALAVVPSLASSVPSCSSEVDAQPMDLSLTATEYVCHNRDGPSRPHKYVLQLDSGAHYNALVPRSAMPAGDNVPVQKPPLPLHIQALQSGVAERELKRQAFRQTLRTSRKLANVEVWNAGIDNVNVLDTNFMSAVGFVSRVPRRDLPNDVAMGTAETDHTFEKNVPSAQDHDTFKRVVAVLCGRAAVLRLKWMRKGSRWDCSNLPTQEIKHEYSDKMSKAGETFSIGLKMFDQMKDTSKILAWANSWAPGVTAEWPEEKAKTDAAVAKRKQRAAVKERKMLERLANKEWWRAGADVRLPPDIPAESPAKQVEEKTEASVARESEDEDKADFGAATLSGQILEQFICFGDGLTEKLLKHMIHKRSDSIDLLDTTCAAQPACADFHTEMQWGDQCTRMLDCKAGSFLPENDPKNDPGTWASLIHAVGRSQVKFQWKDGFAENEEFLEDVWGAHLTGFLLKHFGMANANSEPTKNLPTTPPTKEWFDQQMLQIVEDTWHWSLDLGASAKPAPVDDVEYLVCPNRCGKQFLPKSAAWYSKHVHGHGDKPGCVYDGAPRDADPVVQDKSEWWFCSKGCGFGHALRYSKAMLNHEDACDWKGEDRTPHPPPTRDDCVHNCTLVLFQMLSLFLAFRDCIRFGNGPLVVDFYKWLFVLGRQGSNWSKYAPIALYLWVCVHVLLSPQMSHRLVWDRLTCSKDTPGNNFPVDQKVEHYNCTCKACIKRLGHQNINSKSLERIGAAITQLHHVQTKFDKANGVKRPQTMASLRDRQRVNHKAEQTMLAVLLEADVFTRSTDPAGRAHRAFEGMQADPFARTDVADLRRYFDGYHEDYINLQDVLYSRAAEYPEVVEARAQQEKEQKHRKSGQAS